MRDRHDPYRAQRHRAKVARMIKRKLERAKRQGK